MKRYKVGDLIGQQYKIERILGGEGESGRGTVFICSEDHNIHALKTLQNQFLSSEEMVNAFKREALAWVHLEKHPYIVRANYVINIDDRPFIVLDYVAPDRKGRNTLTHFLEEPLSMKRALKWSIQICYAMEYGESRGISPHRDIKPDNIMITQEENVKITDYGLAVFFDEGDIVGDWKDMAETGEIGLTFLRISKGEVVGGTVPWMASEQFEGKADIRSDIYSFGIVLYQMANNGELPYILSSIEDFYFAHKKQPLPKLDSKLYPIIEKCCQKNPDDRYQNFKELRLEMEELYINDVGEMPPIPPKEKMFQAWEHNNKGVSYTELGFIDYAKEEFKKVLSLNPQSENAHNNLGFIYKKEGKLDKAIKLFKEALTIKPDFMNAHHNLAKVLVEKKLLNEAADEYRTILRMRPNLIIGHYNLAKALEAIEDYNNAIYYYQNFIDFCPPKDARLKKKAKIARGKIKIFKKKTK